MAKELRVLWSIIIKYYKTPTIPQQSCKTALHTNIIGNRGYRKLQAMNDLLGATTWWSTYHTHTVKPLIVNAQNPKLPRPLSRFAIVFAQFIEARF